MAENRTKSPQRNVKKTEPPPSAPEPAQAEWAELFLSFLSRFNRFGWDLLGVGLLAFALVSLLAVTRLTQGAWIDPWSAFLLRWFGWGSFLAVVLMGGLGFAALRRSFFETVHFSLGKALAWEGVFFAALLLLSSMGSRSVDLAEAGRDPGGLVGWGLAELFGMWLGPAWTAVLAGLGLLAFLSVALGLPGWLDRWIEQAAAGAGQPAWGEETAQAGAVKTSPPEPLRAAPPVSAAGKEDKGRAVTPLQRLAQLPPQFRKSLTPEAPPVSVKPAAVPVRSERLPPLNLLLGELEAKPDEREINLTAGLIEKTLDEFGVPARVVGYRVGPTVTQFAVEPGFVEKPGSEEALQRMKVRVAQISGLSRDLALALSAERLRIEAPVPGRSYVGIEVPNSRSSVVRLRSILESEKFYKVGAPLAVALGKDVSGQPVVADLARMPHLLIAGTTGSGKSVCIEAITACLVMNNTPEDLRLAMIDPKMVELVRFNGLPHLLGKVETEHHRVQGVLQWAIVEMEHRYRLLEQVHARNLDSYNSKMERKKQPTLPKIVIIIDELADLMMSDPEPTEHSLVRLAQKARAIGIHLIVATQRPSVDVVTGLIKANFPSRISFTMASSIDSRVILDTNGAETLLGRGDMLFLNPESGIPQRAQGVLITDQEQEKIIAFWQKMIPESGQRPAPWEEILNQAEDGEDVLVEKAVAIVKQAQKASASLLQRRLHIGYPRAARLIDQLEDMGIVGSSQGGGKDRDVLVDPDPDEEDPGEYDARE